MAAALTVGGPGVDVGESHDMARSCLFLSVMVIIIYRLMVNQVRPKYFLEACGGVGKLAPRH